MIKDLKKTTDLSSKPVNEAISVLFHHNLIDNCEEYYTNVSKLLKRLSETKDVQEAAILVYIVYNLQ